MRQDVVNRAEWIPPEIAFLIGHGIPADALAAAARIAREAGVSGDAALIRSGLLDEARYYGALARECGLPFRERLDDVHPLARFPEAVLSGLVPLAGDGGPAPGAYAWAPRGDDVVRLLRGDVAADQFVLTTPCAIRDRVMAVRAEAIAARAADGLARAAPDWSFRAGPTLGQLLAAAAGCVAASLSTWLWPDETHLALACLVTAGFLGITTLRLAAIVEPVPVAPPGPLRRAADRDLPVYTVLVPLYREARVLPKLVRALEAIDYPAAKLDAKILIEAGDGETAAALAAMRLPGFVEIVTVPEGAPRTKPRALNVGLDLARGEHVAVYDAEDVPDPGQLRLAAAAFARSEAHVACFQARLVIDNAADTWLTRLFAVEYAALFDVINPALARLDMPVPLGGTSNHFRTAVLKGLGGWDAWNVTEDADLGIRLAAAGYRVGDLPSATLEEAPRTLPAWMRQRTRWMKGLLQVAITHSRRPIHNLRRLGPARLGAAAALTTGAVLSALGFPLFTIVAVEAVVSGRLFTAQTPGDILAAALAIPLLVMGCATLTLPPLEGLRRRGWWNLVAFVPLMPLYYGLVSVAAWRGLLELLLAPDRWNKTEHGLARTSLAAQALTGAGAGPQPPRPAAAPR